MIAVLLLFALPGEAHAVRVGNCDDVPHQVNIIDASQPFTITLAPGQTKEFYGIPIELGIAGQETRRAPHNAEFCIWDGKLSIQRRSGINRGDKHHR